MSPYPAANQPPGLLSTQEVELLMKSTALFLTVMLASAAAFAADASAGRDAQATRYTYGMTLDVAEVLAIDEAPHGRCELVPTEMTYRDSRGQVQSISYLKHDMYCD